MITTKQLRDIFNGQSFLREADPTILPYCTIIGGQVVGLHDAQAIVAVERLIELINQQLKENRDAEVIKSIPTQFYSEHEI